MKLLGIWMVLCHKAFLKSKYAVPFSLPLSDLIDHISFPEKLIGDVKHNLPFINLHWFADQTISVQIFPNFILITGSNLSWFKGYMSTYAIFLFIL